MLFHNVLLHGVLQCNAALFDENSFHLLKLLHIAVLLDNALLQAVHQLTKGKCETGKGYGCPGDSRQVRGQALANSSVYLNLICNIGLILSITANFN